MTKIRRVIQFILQSLYLLWFALVQFPVTHPVWQYNVYIKILLILNSISNVTEHYTNDSPQKMLVGASPGNYSNDKCFFVIWTVS